MKNKFTELSLILLIVVAAILGFFWKNTVENRSVYRLKEPMLISNSKGEPYYMIPTKTALHFQEGFAEGHQLYTMEVFFKGELPADRLAPQAAAESTWLYRIEADEVSKVLQQYPLSKDDLVRILKARKMTRDDLAQLVRDWED